MELIHMQGTYSVYPQGSQVVPVVKNLPANVEDAGLGTCPREGDGNPLQYSCPENPMDEEPGGLQSMGSQRVGHD